MSVGILISFQQSLSENQYIPLETESNFQEFWLPLAEAHALQWIPLFASGISLSRKDVKPVLNEVVEMQQIIEQSDLKLEMRVKMLNRLSKLQSLLEGLNLDNIEDIFIG